MILVPIITFWIAVLTLKWLFDHLDGKVLLILVSACLGVGVYALIGVLVSPSHPVTWHFLLGTLAAGLIFVTGNILLAWRNNPR
jgi:hypothetical protein